MVNTSLVSNQGGIAEIIGADSLNTKIKSDKKLRIKYGVDPTRPDIHIGHAVVLRKLKQLQDLGHTIIFLIGDYTTKIGDPTGVNKTRPILSDDEIQENAKTYLDQVGEILDVNKTEIRYNSEWFDKLSFADILQITAKFTVASIIERDDFQKRLNAGTEIGLHELLYPVMQAYDSIMLKADVEVGGSDQRFNILAGRELQKKMGQIPQDIILFDLLVGTDGKEKMSKSKNNFISITEHPDGMFGKIMSIPDPIILNYFELAADYAGNKLESVKSRINSGENPRDIKLDLAEAIVTLYHTEDEAKNARQNFLKIFSEGNIEQKAEDFEIETGDYSPVDLVAKLNPALSKSESRRLVEQGALKVNGEKIISLESDVSVKKGDIVQTGKLKVFKIQ